MCFMEQWLKEQSIPRFFQINLSTAWQQVFPRDAMRYVCTLPGNNAALWLFAFSDNQPTTYQFTGYTSSSWIYLTRVDLGDMITFPLWVQLNAGTQLTTFLTMSYNPERKRKYDHWAEQQLAKHGAL